MGRSRWLFALALAPLAVGAAHAEHEAADRLRKRITVGFLETPMERAVQEIGRLANVAVVVDTKGLRQTERRFPVSLQLKGSPAREVLDLLVKDAGIGYSLDGLVVFVSTRAKTRAEDLARRTYDIRDLTYSIFDFPGPDFTPKPYGRSTAGAGPISLDAPAPESMVAAGSLGELIMSRIRPSEWGADIGTSIEERGGQLVVMQTEEVHAEIKALLDNLRATEGLFIRIEAKGFLVDNARLEAALEGTSAPGFLRPEELERVEGRLTAGGAERLGTVRTICTNNQRTHVFTGTISHYVSDVDVSGFVFDPVMAQAFEGFIVDVLPVASHDRRFVTLELRIEAPKLRETHGPRTVIEGSSRVLRKGASWDASKKDNEFSMSGDAGGESVVTVAPARIQGMDVDARHVLTNVQVPKGVAAYAAVPAGEGRSALLVVRPTIAGQAP